MRVDLPSRPQPSARRRSFQRATLLLLALSPWFGCSRQQPGSASSAQDAAAPPAPLRWAVPVACPLVYDFRSREGFEESKDAAPGSSLEPAIEVTGQVEARVEPGSPARWDLHLRWVSMAHVHGELRNPGTRSTTYAPVHLTTDGSAWTEIDGPTMLWSAHGTSHGLVLFWPSLPPGAAPRSEAPWRILLHERAAARTVEAQRGQSQVPTGVTLPAPSPPLAVDARVTIVRWTEAFGAPAAELEASWTVEESSGGGTPAPGVPKPPGLGEPDVSMQASAKYRGTYVVLASGRLLQASVEKTTDTVLRMGATAPLRQRIRMIAEARLISACAGPTLPTLHDGKRTPEERALDAHAALRNALLEGKRAEAKAALSGALLKRHGEEQVLDLLAAHVKRFGASSLGTPEMSTGVERDGDRLRFELSGSAQKLHGPDSNAAVPIEVLAEIVDGGVRIRSLRATFADEVVIEVSEERLFSKALGGGGVRPR